MLIRRYGPFDPLNYGNGLGGEPYTGDGVGNGLQLVAAEGDGESYIDDVE